MPKEDKRKYNGATPKGPVKRSKAFSVSAMPQVVAWVDKQVRKLGLKSRSDWVEHLWKQDQK